MRCLIALITLASACAFGCSASEPANPPAPQSTAAEPVSTGADALASQCVTVRNRERACTREYIPALVDLRVELDAPAGIAAQAKKDGRDALVAEAMKEWEVDSAQPEAFCKQQMARMPQAQAASMLGKASACAKESTCDSFVKCWLPLIRPTLH
ncbi:MAG: hypothetical protein HY898_09255 [Deltaproteobacteria bacterium]|nr:hypothetical protein [Deltaproteobacteria bacterium]